MNASVGLLPLPRPLMTVEMLDAAFRLFRAGMPPCLPFSGLLVLVLELPTLYATFIGADFAKGGTTFVLSNITLIGYGVMFVLSVPLLGLMTLRLHALAEGRRPRLRSELATALIRWPMGLFVTAFAFGYPLALLVFQTALLTSMPATAIPFAAVPAFWPVGIFVIAMPAYWCGGLSAVSSMVEAVRLSIRRSWHMFGAMLATVCMVAVFVLLVSIIVLIAPLFGRVDLYVMATVRAILFLIVGALGVPFVLSVLIVAYQDLKLRDSRRRGARA